jgi:hypothetical protein
VRDTRRLYRSDFFPGLGWMLRAQLWQEIKCAPPLFLHIYTYISLLLQQSLPGPAQQHPLQSMAAAALHQRT